MFKDRRHRKKISKIAMRASNMFVLPLMDFEVRIIKLRKFKNNPHTARTG